MICEKCNYTTKNWYIFKQHLECHKDKFCPRCNKQIFASEKLSASHVLKNHLRHCKPKESKPDPLVCDKCGRKFNCRQSKSAHKKVCGMVFKCNACETIFSTKRRLTLHKCPNFQLPNIQLIMYPKILQAKCDLQNLQP